MRQEIVRVYLDIVAAKAGKTADELLRWAETKGARSSREWKQLVSYFRSSEVFRGIAEELSIDAWGKPGGNPGVPHRICSMDEQFLGWWPHGAACPCGQCVKRRLGYAPKNTS